MSTIDTVRGPVALDALGQTLVHEHVVFIDSEFARFYPELAWGGERSAVVDKVVGRLQEVVDRGIGTILDCTALLHGRDMDFLKEVNDRVDLNIIASTGIYTFDHLPHHVASPSRFTNSADDILTRMFLRDLTVGIADSGIRAQSIKVAVDKQGFTPNIERVFRAAGRASAETGAPITVHTHPADHQAARALELLAGEGADVGTVVIGHSGDTTDVDYLRSIIAAGAVVGSDRFGLYLLPETASEQERIDILATLAAEGHADRVVLSHDAVLYSDWSEPGSLDGVEALKTWVPTRISDVVIPALVERGVRQTDIDAMLVGAPASLFTNIAA
ncbi:phosphotriesterase family protein [Curtobacterium sp. VKM Ac-2887]|uniref:phosphotriesterase family protein n=1 Tax=Curtobacterium sp. VKM Ac-2887 TaxID=2783819 RepID=UPI00188A19C5|nr:phosphotriesterase-related protein [Curtobacterium sp. VKM Ac-2887]MBF4585678.1 phosphotriesterase-related protein [Curtobacterium sp. VKM Ac-2887]